MSREAHVRFCEGPGVQLPRATRLPLYRQVQRFTRAGVTLSDSTLGDWTAATADLVEPLYEALKEEALSSGYIQADETPIQVQDQQKEGSTHRGYYWVYHAPPSALVLVDYQPGRGRDGPKGILERYQGALQSDGYAVYDSYDGRPGITGYNCWAHVRRYFFEAQENAPELAAHALEEIGRLYGVERVLRERNASPEHRRQRRQEQAVPILERFKVWLEAHPGLPKSPWGQAAGYALGRWEKLIRYTEDGRIEIGRVGRWRGGVGPAYLLPPLSSGGASIAQPCSVSTSRSSNRTCRFPASGSHL